MAKQEKKLTGWINGDQFPVRVGLYERNYTKDYVCPFDYWNGSKWVYHFGDGHPDNEKNIYAGSTLMWRGLARRPR